MFYPLNYEGITAIPGKGFAPTNINVNWNMEKLIARDFTQRGKKSIQLENAAKPRVEMQMEK